MLVDLFHLILNRLEIVVRNVFLNVCNGVTRWNKKVCTEQKLHSNESWCAQPFSVCTEWTSCKGLPSTKVLQGLSSVLHPINMTGEDNNEYVNR